MASSSRAADVVIIGGGITGCSTAYHLAKAGSRVVLLEKDSIAYEGTGRTVAAVRLMLRHPLEYPIAVEAVKRWRQLDEELGMDTEFRTTGNFMVTFHEEEVDALREEVEHQRSRGLSIRLVTAREELKELVPGLSDAVVAGMFSTEDGRANPHRTTMAYATAARRLVPRY